MSLISFTEALADRQSILKSLSSAVEVNLQLTSAVEVNVNLPLITNKRLARDAFAEIHERRLKPSSPSLISSPPIHLAGVVSQQPVRGAGIASWLSNAAVRAQIDQVCLSS